MARFRTTQRPEYDTYQTKQSHQDVKHIEPNQTGPNQTKPNHRPVISQFETTQDADLLGGHLHQTNSMMSTYQTKSNKPNHRDIKHTKPSQSYPPPSHNMSLRPVPSARTVPQMPAHFCPRII